MASKVTPKRAGAPMSYNNAIRVDTEPIKNSDALITSGGVYFALEHFDGWEHQINGEPMKTGVINFVTDLSTNSFDSDTDTDVVDE